MTRGEATLLALFNASSAGLQTSWAVQAETGLWQSFHAVLAGLLVCAAYLMARVATNNAVVDITINNADEQAGGKP